MDRVYLQAVVIRDAVVVVLDAGFELVDVVRIVGGQVGSARSHVGDIQNVVRSKLMLHLQVPLFHRAGFALGVYGDHAGSGRRVRGVEVRIATRRQRNAGVAAGAVCNR